MQVPQTIAEATVSLTTNPYIFLIFINIILFLAGMFMETNAAVLLLSPLLFPSVMALGIDPVHFGIILVTNIEIGLITPPMAATSMFQPGSTDQTLWRCGRTHGSFW